MEWVVMVLGVLIVVVLGVVVYAVGRDIHGEGYRDRE